ncbi:MAG: transcription termination/antitermination protein NusG [Gemmataceae bacterium]
MSPPQHPSPPLPAPPADAVIDMLDRVPRWTALRTSAHWEKQIAAALSGCDIPVYLPLMSQVTVYRSKRRTADVPLFSGYVFCSETDFRDNPKVPAAIRKKIAQMLRSPEPERFRQELRDVAELLRNRRLVQERVFGRPGDVVRVVGGPLHGSEGVIRRLKPEKRLIVLEITFLGVRLEVELEEHQIRPA